MKPAAVKFVWEHKTMFFSTDPVAMDRIGWMEVDRQRAAIGFGARWYLGR